jgi:hypothetical protein
MVRMTAVVGMLKLNDLRPRAARSRKAGRVQIRYLSTIIGFPITEIR